MTTLKTDALVKRILSLERWIRDEGERSDVCTWPILKEICTTCRCPRKPDTGTDVDLATIE